MKILLAVATLLVGVLIVAIHSPSPTEAKCWPNRVDDDLTYHDGWKRIPGGAPHGVKAYIINYSPWVKPGNFASAWTMLTKGTYDHWAQVGWWEYAYDDRRTFVQYTTAPNVWQTVFSVAKPVGAFTEYRVEWWGYFAFWVDGQGLGTAPAAFTPSEGQIYGEINTLANQMPGGFNNYEVFTLSRINTGGWVPFQGTARRTPVGGNPNYWGQNVIDPNYQMAIWDPVCSN